jgi:FkbM family methyltransferase
MSQAKRTLSPCTLSNQTFDDAARARASERPFDVQEKNTLRRTENVNPLEEVSVVPKKTLRFMTKYASSDPMGFGGMLKRRAVEHFSARRSGIAQTTFADVTYEIDLSLHKLTTKYLHHTHEMFLERIFDKFLVPGSTFIDIGANCGYWSAYALAKVRQTGQVHAFEPVSLYHSFLQRIADLNPTFTLIANNVACGSRNEHRSMAMVLPHSDNFDNQDTNIGSSSLFSGFLSHAADLTHNADVEVIPLDEYILAHSIRLEDVGLIKIDVEGFEDHVLDGMSSVISNNGRKIPILCEILTDLNREHPLDGRNIISRLERCGYRCMDALTFKPIDRNKLGFEENIICV